jgi:HlyD family secretion protein
MIRHTVRWIIYCSILGGVVAAGFFGYQPAMRYIAERNRQSYRTVEVSEGEIIAVVNSTGTVKPVSQVTIGSFVSGPIEELFVEFNQQVEKDEVLARIDPRIYAANVARDEANLATRRAEVERMTADLQRAINDERRAKRLQSAEGGFMSESEFDQIHFNRLSLEAQLKIARASVDEALAGLETSKANLEYCQIRSPVAGTVIDRKIDPGQTLASQFQTPELFVIAPDMQKEMHVFASVDEADIGYIRAARDAGNSVQFTVDAYPDDLFEGKIWQIRQSSTVVQNVVTYPVVVAAPNTDLKLMPGMTANLSFTIESRDKVVRVPNAALRFYPDRELVHPDDQKVLDGGTLTDQDNAVEDKPATAKVAASRDSTLRHVWYEVDGLLRAIEIRVGISDYKNTELISGDLSVGQQLVMGLEVKP